MRVFHDVRRANDDVFARRAHPHAFVKAVHKNVIGPLAGRARDAGQLYRPGQAQGADADHVGQAFQGTVHRVAQHAALLARTGKVVFFCHQVKRGNGRSAGHGVAGIGVAMEKLDGMLGRVGVHHRVVDEVAADHATQRDHAIGHRFGKVQHVGHHAVIVGAKVHAQTAKAGDDLVKNQQDAVLVANLAQALHIALWRDVPARAARNRLDDDRRHIARVVQHQDAVFQLQQGVFGPHRFFVVDVGMVDRVVDETHVVHPGQQLRPKRLAVGRQAAHAHAAEVDAVVTLFAANEHRAVAFAPGAMVSQRHFQGGVGGLRARIAKQHLVKVPRGHVGNHLRRFEGLVVAGLERRGVVQRVELLFDGFVDRLAVVARAHTPQARDAVDDFFAIVGGEVHALGTHEHSGVLAESAVGREGQPLVVHVQIGVGHGKNSLKSIQPASLKPARAWPRHRGDMPRLCLRTPGGCLYNKPS